MLLRRIVLLYIVLLLCRIVFYCYNYALIGPLGWQEVLTLAGGGLKFDTVSVLYANLLFIVLSLLPFHFRERSWYRRILFWYYAVINSLLIVAVNLADCVYFRYTQKRFTADEIFFADNSNSVQLVLKFAAENWYLLLVGAVLIWLLVWGYGRKITPRSPLREGWVYHSVNTGLLVIAILLGIAGMRGGVTRMTRPITLSNATLYASTSEKANLILSNPFCILRTIGSGGSVKYTRYFSPEKLDEYFTPTHRPDSSAVNLEGRNVMVFILESMSAEHSAYLKPELYGNGTQPGYTPFLDSLMRQSLCFGQMYANGTRSIQAMPAVLGSIPSFKQPFVLMPPVAGQKPPTAADTPRQRLPNRLLLRFGARFDGIRSLRPQRQHRAAPEPRGLRSGTRHRGFRRLLGHLGRTVPAIHGRRTLENAGTILRHAVHPLVAPSLRRARTISQRAARRNDQNP